MFFSNCRIVLVTKLFKPIRAVHYTRDSRITHFKMRNHFHKNSSEIKAFFFSCRKKSSLFNFIRYDSVECPDSLVIPPSLHSALFAARRFTCFWQLCKRIFNDLLGVNTQLLFSLLSVCRLNLFAIRVR